MARRSAQEPPSGSSRSSSRPQARRPSSQAGGRHKDGVRRRPEGDGPRSRPSKSREAPRIESDPRRTESRARRSASRSDRRPGQASAGPKGPGSRASQVGGRPATHEGEGERLQKVLSRAGLASRREAEEWIRTGRITVNGQPAVLGVRVLAEDQLRLDGRLIRQREPSRGATAFVCHRSPGESLTQPHTESAEEGAAPGTALIERLPSRAGRRFITVSPMPRMDGGLELVTSDGELGVRLQRAVRHLVSQYSVRVLGELSPEQIQGILNGSLDSGEQIEVHSCEPAGGESANRWYTLVARGASGKQVRQLLERAGATVSRVQRTHLGPITMERSLGRGHFRELTSEELEALTTPAPAPEDI